MEEQSAHLRSQRLAFCAEGQIHTASSQVNLRYLLVQHLILTHQSKGTYGSSRIQGLKGSTALRCLFILVLLGFFCFFACFFLLEPTKYFVLLKNSIHFALFHAQQAHPFWPFLRDSKMHKGLAQLLYAASLSCCWQIACLIVICLNASRNICRDQLIILGLCWWSVHCVVLRRRNRQSAPHTASCL